MTDNARTDTTGQACDGTQESRSQRLRNRYPWLDHLIRANGSFSEHYGNHYAAAITYFSVLTLVPLLMVAFAIAGFVLAGNATLLYQLQHAITMQVPGTLGDTINGLVSTAINARATVGVVGLVIALYSGIGWMSNLRDALTAQWSQQRRALPLLPTLLKDLLSLLGLGLAIVVSFVITAAGSGLGSLVLRLAGLVDDDWTHALLIALSVILALFANWLVFLWVIARLPRQAVGVRAAIRGAAMAAVGFEILKQAAANLLTSAAHSPTASVFGSIIGLLVFANLVARLLLFATAWTATAADNQVTLPIKPPQPVVIQPLVHQRRGIGPVAAVGLFAVGALSALILHGRRRHDER